jgi:hypothetical protein
MRRGIVSGWMGKSGSEGGGGNLHDRTRGVHRCRRGGMGNGCGIAQFLKHGALRVKLNRQHCEEWKQTDEHAGSMTSNR